EFEYSTCASSVFRESRRHSKPGLPVVPLDEGGHSGLDVGLQLLDLILHHATALPVSVTAKRRIWSAALPSASGRRAARTPASTARAISARSRTLAMTGRPRTAAMSSQSSARPGSVTATTPQAFDAGPSWSARRRAR